MQNQERRRDARELKKHQQRVKAAREEKSSSIPGPKEAKECMLMLENNHLVARKLKLQVFQPPALFWLLTTCISCVSSRWKK